ncbi:MAG: cytochrome c [Saprospiraceae bacterium]|nr:cytochrome c [Candidatus Defluviibacterium haderslevense]
MKTIFYIIFSIMLVVAAISCSPADGNNSGHEYMPDMAHSVAYEANVDNYYYYHTWDSKETYHEFSKARQPVNGTIPRGMNSYSPNDSTMNVAYNAMMTGATNNTAIRTPENGHVNYYYADTEPERIRATNEITTNPVPITGVGLESGKQLYDIYCATCHGATGDGAGYLVRDDGGVYPAQPANFLKDEFIATTEGRFYHAIMYGRNVMSGYTSKLSYQERWNVIHFIRSLQAKSKNLVYSEKENTFSGSQAIADAKKAFAASTAVPAVPKTK